MYFLFKKYTKNLQTISVIFMLSQATSFLHKFRKFGEFLHCNENLIFVFPEIGLVHIFSSRRIGRPIVGIYKSLTETWMWKLGLGHAIHFLGIFVSNFCIVSLQCGLCYVQYIIPLVILNIYVQKTHKHLLAERSYRNKRQEIEFGYDYEKKLL
jgi:hypothetical protein